MKKSPSLRLHFTICCLQCQAANFISQTKTNAPPRHATLPPTSAGPSQRHRTDVPLLHRGEIKGELEKTSDGVPGVVGDVTFRSAVGAGYLQDWPITFFKLQRSGINGE
jgi:hypothetical protein